MSALVLISANGNGQCTPAATEESCWAAIGAGAQALCLSVCQTRDGVLFCVPSPQVKDETGRLVDVEDLDAAALENLDAGKWFSAIEGDSGVPETANSNEIHDYPWSAQIRQAPLKSREALRYPRLQRLLQVFGRRIPIRLLLPEANAAVYAALAPLLRELGLSSSTIIYSDRSTALAARESHPELDIGFDLRSDYSPLFTAGAGAVLLDLSQLSLISKSDLQGLSLMFSSADGYGVPDCSQLESLQALRCQEVAWLTARVSDAQAVIRPWYTILTESFCRTDIDVRNWHGGYSHINPEALLQPGSHGLSIVLKEGSQYAGAGVVCTLAVHGDFDAEVEFEVKNPHQATTFELAAIGNDPGYHHPELAGLNTRSANLTFDVHGSPPYASSERDQNDGFRCGWNNCYNLTQVRDDFQASSVNMYNKYGRDVGDGGPQNPTGKLRLMRHGAVFTTFYQDRYSPNWIGSGAMLVQSMPKDCYIRLAAKHWAKLFPAPAPWNEVRFRNFVLRQH